MDKYKINAQNSLFLIIDLQGNLASAMKKDVYSNVEKNVDLLISSCNILNVPIIVTEQYKKGLGTTVEQIKNNLGERYKPVDKLSFSAYAEPAVQSAIKQLNKKYVIVAGIESHVCVLQTALDLISEDYIVHIISDAVCSRFKNDWENAMDYMINAGAVISTTEIVVFQLLRKAGTPEFKAISPLFKNKESYWSLK